MLSNYPAGVTDKDFTTPDDIYVSNGYANRSEYLENLADDHGVDLDTVHMLADLLGSSEDFDGLVTSLEDADGFM